MEKTQNKTETFLPDDTTVIIELHPFEIQLIKAMRNNWRFGEVTIKVRDGLPVKLVRVMEFLDMADNQSIDKKI